MKDMNCPHCSAPLIRGSDWHGQASYRCQYCGNNVMIHPEKISDKLLTFANRIANAISSEPQDPAEKAKLDAKRAEIKMKQLLIQEEYAARELEKLQRKTRGK